MKETKIKVYEAKCYIIKNDSKYYKLITEMRITDEDFKKYRNCIYMQLEDLNSLLAGIIDINI